MKSRRFLSIALLITMLLAASVAPALAQEGSTAAVGATSASTAFVLQNLGDVADTGVRVEFRSAAGGAPTKVYDPITIEAGAAYNMDQRYASGDPGANPFEGAVIAYGTQPLGSVVNLVVSGAAPSYESYNGLNEKAVGTSMRVLQVLKNVSSGGVAYNTKIAIQNTSVDVDTPVTVYFVPDPALNPAVGGTLTTEVSKNYTVPKGGTLVIDQATQSDPNIGTKFFGSARIEATGAAVGVVTTSDGGGQLTLAYPSYAGGSTSPIGLPSVYKNISSQGLSYSTAFLIANMGTDTATVEIQYIAVNGTVSGKDTVTIAKGAVKNVDQRYDAPSITSASFMGSAVVTPVPGTGTLQPVAVMANLRGGSRYAMTYGGLTSGVAAGGKLFLPVGYKNISSQGYSWSSTIVFHTFTPDAQVKVKYIDNRTGVAAWESDTFTVQSGTQFDLRYHASTTGHDTFFGAMVVQVLTGQVGAIVQTRGSNGSGDALMAYGGLSQ